MAFFGRAYSYYHLEEYELAIDDYTESIELNPDYAGTYNNRGLCYNAIEEYDLAIDDFKKAIELAPESPIAYNNLAFSYIQTGQLDLALEAINIALSISPKGCYYDTRGDVYKEIGDTDLMCQDYQTACEMGCLEGCEKQSELCGT
jgi:tetratricopeptide (TPR) repeat protein